MLLLRKYCLAIFATLSKSFVTPNQCAELLKFCPIPPTFLQIARIKGRSFASLEKIGARMQNTTYTTCSVCVCNTSSQSQLGTIFRVFDGPQKAPFTRTDNSVATHLKSLKAAFMRGFKMNEPTICRTLPDSTYIEWNANGVSRASIYPRVSG